MFTLQNVYLIVAEMLTLHYKSLLDLFLCLLHASVRQQQFFMTRLFKLSTNFLPFVFSIHIQLSKTLSEIYFLIKKNKRWRLLFLLYLPNQCNVSLHRDYISARKIKRKCKKKILKSLVFLPFHRKIFTLSTPFYTVGDL